MTERNYVTTKLNQIITIRIILLFILFCGYTSFGQENKILDSLHLIIKNIKDEDLIIKHYENTFYSIINNSKNSLILVDDLKKIGETKNCQQCIIKANYLKGYYYYHKGEYTEAIPILKNLFTRDKLTLNDKYKTCNLLSACFMSKGDLLNAKIFANQLTEINNPKYLAYKITGHTLLGIINDEQNYLRLSFLNYVKADSLNNLQPKSKNYIQSKAIIYSNIFTVLLKLKEYDKAQEYLEKAMHLYETDSNSENYMYAKQNMAYLELERKNYTRALDTLLKTTKYFKKNESTYHLGEAYYLLGRTFLGLKNYPKAIDNLNNSLAIFTKIGDSISIGLNYKYLGESYLKLNSIVLAEHNLIKAKNVFLRLNSYNYLLLTLQDLSQLYYKKNNLKKSLEYITKKDSINSFYQEKIKESEIYELETLYQTKQKEQQINLLTSQNKLEIQKKKNQSYIYISIITLLVFGGLTLFISYKNKQKVTKKLAELDKEKSNLFGNISHEFRTPLTLIKTPVEQLLQNENLPIEQKSILTLVKRNADRLLDLVTQLLDISKIENNQLKLGVTPNNPKQFFNVLCDGFSYLAKQKQIIFLPYINCNLSDVWFDKDLVEKISTNILFNALKYTPEKGTVICNVYCENNLLNIEIKNTGKGLTKEEEAKIFERFYQADHLSPGIGLGLALVKELVTTHKGKIHVTNIPNQWTTFLITLPVNKNSYKKSEIQEETNTTREPTLQIESSSPTEIQENKILEETENSQNSTSKKELPIMLLVDDNKDVRTLLKHTFSPCYTILEASNGKEGIEKALEHIPDIIISDVMMPEIDGFKLCSTLKNDFKTSHIPIILLTAKAGQENLMEGTLCGADDYIVKPFNLDYLQAKVENLISSRKKLQQRYKQDAVLTPQDLAVTNLDQDFLQRIEDILKEQLTETSFNTEAFAKAACLSRMQLHRKLKALTGLSATEFIRSQRLKLAAHLLKQSDANVSEIGYQVGFSSPAYFSKLFKDAYGCSPSEYANRK